MSDLCDKCMLKKNIIKLKDWDLGEWTCTYLCLSCAIGIITDKFNIDIKELRELFKRRFEL